MNPKEYAESLIQKADSHPELTEIKLPDGRFVSIEEKNKIMSEISYQYYNGSSRESMISGVLAILFSPMFPSQYLIEERVIGREVANIAYDKYVANRLKGDGFYGIEC